ncbi:MAG TPA: hypothetical protein VFJ61_00370 [Solirubrobacterales bacterium]|nr:hypothetical protein [Solirubrobacterales bacterium]
MDHFAETFALARYLWPRLFAVLLLVGIVFFQKPTYGLVEAEVKHRAREYTALLMRAVLPDAKPQGPKRIGRHRGDLTGAPTGAPQFDRIRSAHP